MKQTDIFAHFIKSHADGGAASSSEGEKGGKSGRKGKGRMSEKQERGHPRSARPRRTPHRARHAAGVVRDGGCVKLARSQPTPLRAHASTHAGGRDAAQGERD